MGTSDVGPFLDMLKALDEALEGLETEAAALRASHLNRSHSSSEYKVQPAFAGVLPGRLHSEPQTPQTNSSLVVLEPPGPFLQVEVGS